MPFTAKKGHLDIRSSDRRSSQASYLWDWKFQIEDHSSSNLLHCAAVCIYIIYKYIIHRARKRQTGRLMLTKLWCLFSGKFGNPASGTSYIFDITEPLRVHMDSEVWVQCLLLNSQCFTSVEVKQAHLGFRFLICKVAIIFLFKIALTMVAYQYHLSSSSTSFTNTDLSQRGRVN